MKQNKKGQALVEFVIILPIFLLLVLGVMDIGKILYNETRLEGVLNDVISMYESGSMEEDIITTLDLDDTHLEVLLKEDYVEFHLSKEMDIITPGLNFILDNPFVIDVSRSIPYE